MKELFELTILTPSYNRAAFLPRLYESLKKQTVHDFQWLVIDDGSTDDTFDYLKSIASDYNDFLFEYYNKDNGGKHTALNFSHPYIKGEWTCIVDSDDWLIPEAVEKILNAIKKYKSDDDTKVITFLKGNAMDAPLVDDFPLEPVVSNHIVFKVNADRSGDCCEVVKTDIFKNRPFPVFQGERFLAEGYLWNYIGFRYNSVYIRDVVYLCEYLPDGLTRSGRRLRINCPRGGMACSSSFFEKVASRKVKRSILFKEAMLYVCYGKFAKLNYKHIFNGLNSRMWIFVSYIPGVLLYKFWKLKYMKK